MQNKMRAHSAGQKRDVFGVAVVKTSALVSRRSVGSNHARVACEGFSTDTRYALSKYSAIHTSV